jgi:xanthine dehydrogenase large subunit
MSLPHDFAHTHVKGESEFIDDRPAMRNEVFADVFYSTRAHANIQKLDFSEVLKDPRIIAVYTYVDFHDNMWGTIFRDQPLLAPGKVQFAGEPIAIIVATTLEAAQYGKQKVIIEYIDLPAILTIEEATSQKSFIIDSRKIERGNVVQAMSEAPHKLSGKIIIQGQDHFYLESQASIAYPLEDNQMEIHSSSQHPTETQHVVAHALGISNKDVVCQVKRMGGGFGGKESQAAPFAAFAALAAKKLNRPVRLCLTKDDDMVMTGKRNPFENNYQVGFDNQGKILALSVQLFSDAGAYADLSTSIMERAMLHCDNAYYIENMRVVGQVCKTNHHPHTAFRGFGGPKGVATIEKIIEEISHALKMDSLEVRKINLYRDDQKHNKTHFGQIFKNNCLSKLFLNLEKSSDYQNRRKNITDYNNEGHDSLRGLSLTAVKFGISFTTRFLNQANAMVIIHNDGSIQISTGATEMGQGVNARISQLVTEELGLERSNARVMPTRTDKNANTSPSAASASTDLNGGAAVLATRKIKKRLSEFASKLLKVDPSKWATKTAGLGTALEINLEGTSEGTSIDSQNPNEDADWQSGVATYDDMTFENGFVFHHKNSNHKIEFKQLVLEAYLNRISLCDYAFYKLGGIEFNKLTGTGNPFLYFTQGVACSEVSLCKNTGEVKVLRSDILMDLGRPINRDLDIGQIAGGFIQGQGWVTTENLVYNDQGLLLSHAPSTYKIPNIQDTPRIFNIDLLQNEENYANLRGTKAVGEPPFLLGISIWAAINNALTYLPTYEGDAFPQIKIPATSENVLRAIHPKKFQIWDKK